MQPLHQFRMRAKTLALRDAADNFFITIVELCDDFERSKNVRIWFRDRSDAIEVEAKP